MKSLDTLGSDTVIVIDNFFSPNNLKLVTEEVKKLQFWNADDHPDGPDYGYWPGIRTNKFSIVNPTLDSLIIKHIKETNAIFTQQPWKQHQYAHLRTEKDNEEDFVHQDSNDWAYLIYLSETNLDSGTKMYESAKSELDFMTPEIKDVIQSKFGEFNIALSHSSTKEDKEHTFVKFVQNRIVMFDSSIPHMAWNNHGNDLTDGRLTINGFCDCDNS